MEKNKSVVTVIINENHSLLPSQREEIDKRWTSFEVLSVPAQGWTIDEMDEVPNNLEGDVLFVSPVPYLLSKLSWCDGYGYGSGGCFPHEKVRGIFLFHNDQRVSKEVPDGKGGTKVIHVVSPEGWEIIQIKMNVYCSKCGRFIGIIPYRPTSKRFFGLSAADHKSLLCENCWKLEDSSNVETEYHWELEDLPF